MLQPGKYVVAVSGGVDSVALLDILVRTKRPDATLIVAHFDHGVRADSRDDRLFVQSLAQKYGLNFVFDEGGLGRDVSEAAARDARYKFLRRVQKIAGARAIILAHHEDDALETAILNMARGTGRKGLTSLQSKPDLYRPLLNVPKNSIIAYARLHGLEWHEDSTNADDKYLRNHVRHNVLSRFDARSRQRLKQLLARTHIINKEVDALINELLQAQPAPDKLGRHWFTMLPHDVSREVMAAWLRANGVAGFDKKAIERIVAQAKVLPKGKQIDIGAGRVIVVKSNTLEFSHR